MKHVKGLSSVKLAKADEVAWVSLSNIFGLTPLSNLQARWVSARVDQGLQK